MIKTHSVLHDKLLVPRLARQVLTLPVYFCGSFSSKRVLLRESQGEAYFHFVPKKLDGIIREVESIHLRTLTDAFLALKSPIAAKPFFEIYGEWVPDHSTGSDQSKTKWSEIAAFQKMLRKAWIEDFTRWDYGIRLAVLELEVRPDLTNEQPSLFFAVQSIRQLLLADLFFAALSGLPSGFCARKDCQKVFQKHTKHPKKFCSVECAHIESVRQHRARISKKRGNDVHF
jgi:hypothetical protein